MFFKMIFASSNPPDPGSQSVSNRDDPPTRVPSGRRKQEGQKIEVPEERAPAKVINLMDALRRSVEAERSAKGLSSIRDLIVVGLI